MGSGSTAVESAGLNVLVIASRWPHSCPRLMNWMVTQQASMATRMRKQPFALLDLESSPATRCLALVDMSRTLGLLDTRNGWATLTDGDDAAL